MKTLHTTDPRNVIAIHARIRLALAVVGIVTAVLCAMALLQAYGLETDFFSVNRAPGGTLGNQ